MFFNLQMAYWVVYGLLAIMGILTIVIMAIKFKNVRNQKKTEVSLQKFQSYLDYVQSQLDEEDRLRIPNQKVGDFDKKVLQKVLIDWIQRLSGVHRDKLITLCHDLGLIDFNLKQIKSLSEFKRLDAAYYLGSMRSSEAIPDLFKLLKKNKEGPEAFIIGRSIAQAADKPEDVKEMLTYLAKEERENYHLLADIAGESTLDMSVQYKQLLTSENTELVKLALLGLSNQTDSGMDSNVRSFVYSKDKEIRMNAVRLLITSGAWTSGEIKQMIHFNDSDVRAFIAQWIGDSGVVQFADQLQEGVKDSDKIVARTCAKSLLKLGESGFIKLCEVTIQNEGQPVADLALECIQEDLKESSVKTGNIEHVTSYNQKLYLYQKYFGKDEDLTQAI
ncbi:hypothetical protein GLW08_14390 [Pontibacillus yanchengensis]|uniref:HEAT repeat domain-containing protein n=2 Tax=Pontibacillus yanchengensis TaxID=462910 RepID=A0A6I4ZZE9_9BACI|nr:hypothetical protein [Pontibacillus yanchengensis]MYL34654.1 hypothetical protein [Pontibacillus yanchengensis]MYL54521.1 hypothetical protein [Pontibacillus yanchengensis]